MQRPSEAEEQGGAFSRRQARASGLSRGTIIRRLARGTWQVVIPDVFVVAGTPVTPWTRAWAGHLATGGVVCGRTAGAIHAICGADDEIHVNSRTNLHVLAPGVRDHRTRLPLEDVTKVRGLPITTRERTVLDLLGSEPRGAATGLLFRAIQQRWITPEELDRHIGRRKGMTGVVRLRELAGLLDTGAHSVAELELHRILASIDGLRSRANVGLAVAGDRFVVDVLLPDHAIVIEVDGRRFHSDADQFTHDRRRQNALIGAGYLVLRFTWLDVTQSAGVVRRAVTEAIAVSSVAKARRTGP